MTPQDPKTRELDQQVGVAASGNLNSPGAKATEKPRLSGVPPPVPRKQKRVGNQVISSLYIHPQPCSMFIPIPHPYIHPCSSVCRMFIPDIHPCSSAVQCSSPSCVQCSSPFLCH